MCPFPAIPVCRRSIGYWGLFLTLVLAGCKPLWVQRTEPAHIVVQEPAIDSATYRLIQPYKQSLDSQMNEVIGFAPEAMVKGSGETTLGNFFADAMLRKAKKLSGSDTNDLLAIFNNGGLRTNVPQGDVRVGTIFELMPFDNELVFMPLRGSDLARALDVVADKGGAPVSGVRFAMGKKKAYAITVHSSPLDTNKIYTVVTSDYLANGGDRLFAGGKPLPFSPGNCLLRDILMENCRELHKQQSPLKASLDGRISIAE